MSGTRTLTLVAFVAFLGLTMVRTWDIAGTFWLLGDQILYWDMALRPWHELPFGGGPSSVGGTTLGPVFPWFLWLVRHGVGPWTDNLPHAGGIGVAMLQSAADGLLLVSIWKRAQSLALALAAILLVATAPYDLALSATIWNPPVAEAFVKIALAIVLLARRPIAAWPAVLATVSAVLAVQAHSSAIFVAVPVIAALVLFGDEGQGKARLSGRSAFVVATVVIVELPYLVNLVLQAGQSGGPTAVIQSVVYTATHPGMLRFGAAFGAIGAAASFILLTPHAVPWFGAWLAGAGGATAWRLRRDPIALAATVAPIVCAGIGFSFWQQAFDHYWFMTLMPCVAVTLAVAPTIWSRPAPFAAGALLLLVVVAQPARMEASRSIHRLPAYAALVKGSRTAVRQAPEVRALTAAFVLPPTTDAAYLYTVLGGRVREGAAFSASIGPTGDVTYTRHSPDARP